MQTLVFFDHTARWSGGEISLFELVTHLDPARFIPVVVLFEEGPLADKLREKGVRVRVVPLERTVSKARKDQLGARNLLQLGVVFRHVRHLRRVLREEQADLVHCNSLKSDILGGLAARWARVPCVWHVRDRIANDYLPSIIVKAFRKAARILPTRVIAVSQATLETIKLPAKKGVAIHNGISIEKFSRPEYEPFENSKQPHFGLVGRLSPWKGQHIYLEAAAQVLKKCPDARFQIIGDAMFGEIQYKTELCELATRLGIEGSVDWLGFSNEVPQVVGRLDVLVHASTTGEPFGLVIIEGMAAGRPVIATNGGGVPEIVTSATGRLVPMNDVTALAEAMMWMLEHPLEAQRMGCEGKKRAVDHFSIESTVRRIEEVWAQILAPQNSVPKSIKKNVLVKQK